MPRGTLFRRWNRYVAMAQPEKHQHIGGNMTSMTDSGLVAVILRNTKIAELYVLLFLLGTIGVVCLASVRRFSQAVIHRTHWLALVGTILALIGIAFFDFRLFLGFFKENHWVEWMTAIFMFVAAGVGFSILLRQKFRGEEASPMLLLMSTGLLFGTCRELEWGQPFFGEKVWFSRHLFRPRSYVDSSRFEKYSRELSMPDFPFYGLHLFFAALIFLIVIAVAIYLVRHRRTFHDETRSFHKTLAGRFILLGAGTIILAEGLGYLCGTPVMSWMLVNVRETFHGGNEFVEEPLEMLATTFFLTSMILAAKAFPQAATIPASPKGASPEAVIPPK